KTEIRMSIFSLILLANTVLSSGRVSWGLHTATDAFIIPFVAYFLVRRLVTSEHRFCQLTRVIGYMGCYVIVYCLIERFTTTGLFYRLHGPFESANTLHSVLAVVFFIAMINPLHEGRPSLPRLIRRTVMYLVPIVVALTLTRGNWVGFLSGLAIFVMLGRRFLRFSRTLGAVGLTLIFVLLLSLAFQRVVPQELIAERITEQDNALGRF